MSDSFNLDEPQSTPLTLWRVVWVSALVALVIGCIPALVVGLTVTDNFDAQAQNTIDSRVTVTNQLCAATNKVVTASNVQTDYLKGIIIRGAEQSKAFESFYLAAGQPPYRVRLEEAQHTAQDLEDRKLVALDCTALAAAVAQR